ncbi:Myb-like DNA-binding protein [Phytophthora megakarya]|uniref:Myb-like DNA-binding protein n=1 Tax=Phytophthora megakarya TaxID=4795 RepID=A0A225VFV0_9STRA|nr:Myb-like DNA-binding protein [Phytophthora megakarya]
MTHAQKYRQKIQRRRRGLLTSRKIVPPSRESYTTLAVTTSIDDHDPGVFTGSSPTTLDGFSRMENNFAAEDMDAAILAVLEFNDPTLFPMNNEQRPGTMLEFDSCIDDIISGMP